MKRTPDGCLKWRAMGLVLAALWALAPGASRALDITWTNAAGGDFSNPLNWNPNQVPGTADRAVFNIETPEPYTVTWSVPVTNGNFWVAKGRLVWNLNEQRYTVLKSATYTAGFGASGQTLDMVITNGILNVDTASYRSVLGTTTVRVAADVTGNFGRYTNPGIGAGSRVIIDGTRSLTGGRLAVNDGGVLVITNNGSLTLWSNYMTLETGGRCCLAGEDSYLYAAIGTQKIRGDFYIGDGAQARIGGISGSTTTIDGGRLILDRGGVEFFSSTTVYNEFGSVEGQGVTTSILYNVGGWIRPGGTGGVGTLTNKGNFYNYRSITNGMIEVELGGAESGSYDRLAVIGTLYAGGTLAVSLIDGFKPASGNTFDILDFTSVDGEFDTLDLPGAEVNWDITKLYTTGEIRYRPTGTVLMVH